MYYVLMRVSGNAKEFAEFRQALDPTVFVNYEEEGIVDIFVPKVDLSAFLDRLRTRCLAYNIERRFLYSSEGIDSEGQRRWKEHIRKAYQQEEEQRQQQIKENQAARLAKTMSADWTEEKR